jgi:Tol biopolymer transport system component
MKALLSVFLLCCSQDSGVLVATIPDGVRTSLVSFSHDGKTVAYHAFKGRDLWAVVGDWKSQPSPGPCMVVLLENGKDFIYAAFGREKVSVFLREKLLFETTNPREWAWTMPGAVSSDGAVVASYVRHLKTGKSAVALNGKLQELHAGTGSSPVLSRDGKTWAFALEKEDGHCVVVNDKPGPVFDWVTQPVISADGAVVAYGAESEKDNLLILGSQRIPVKKSAKGVFMTSDGKTAGYWGPAKKGDPKGGLQVVIGDHEGPAFASIQPPCFSPDGKHVVYRATRADGTWVLVLDDRILEAEGIQADPVFMADGKRVGYGIRKGNEFRWITVGVE